MKLADFGLSKRSTVSTVFHSQIGTQSYMAPEILDNVHSDASSAQYTDAVDLWAVGCITYRLLTGMVPFPPGGSLWRYCDDRSLFPTQPLLKNDITGSGSKFIRKLLMARAKERPSASQALNHSWITTVGEFESSPSPSPCPFGPSSLADLIRPGLPQWKALGGSFITAPEDTRIFRAYLLYHRL